jgi:hypothetical protein
LSITSLRFCNRKFSRFAPFIGQNIWNDVVAWSSSFLLRDVVTVVQSLVQIMKTLFQPYLQNTRTFVEITSAGRSDPQYEVRSTSRYPYCCSTSETDSTTSPVTQQRKIVYQYSVDVILPLPTQKCYDYPAARRSLAVPLPYLSTIQQGFATYPWHPHRIIRSGYHSLTIFGEINGDHFS